MLSQAAHNSHHIYFYEFDWIRLIEHHFDCCNCKELWVRIISSSVSFCERRQWSIGSHFPDITTWIFQRHFLNKKTIQLELSLWTEQLLLFFLVKNNFKSTRNKIWMWGKCWGIQEENDAKHTGQSAASGLREKIDRPSQGPNLITEILEHDI